MGDLTRNFSTAEFKEDGRPGRTRPPATLVDGLQALRDRIGRPLPILSWFRSEAYSRRVVGHRSIWHERRMAVDIPSGLVTVDQARRAGFTGIGTRGRWVVHVDIRPGPVTIFVDRKP